MPPHLLVEEEALVCLWLLLLAVVAAAVVVEQNGGLALVCWDLLFLCCGGLSRVVPNHAAER